MKIINSGIFFRPSQSEDPNLPGQFMRPVQKYTGRKLENSFGLVEDNFKSEHHLNAYINGTVFPKKKSDKEIRQENEDYNVKHRALHYLQSALNLALQQKEESNDIASYISDVIEILNNSEIKNFKYQKFDPNESCYYYPEQDGDK